MIFYMDLDVYFCLNFLMDFILLLIVHRWNHCTKQIRYIVLAAFVGALYSVVALFVLKNKIIVWICTYLIIGQLLILISTDYEGIKKHLTYLLEFYFGLFFACGLIEIINTSIKQNDLAGLWGRAGAKSYIMTASGMYIGFRIFLKHMRYNLKIKQRITDVEISAEDQTIKTKGLCDSGNMLVEPISGKAVCVVDDEIIKCFENQVLKPVIIPYHSIDKKHGIMKGYWMERIIVNHHTFYKIPVAVHHGNLSKNNDYKILLPPEIYNQRGKCDVFRKIRKTKVTNENADACRNHSSD